MTDRPRPASATEDNQKIAPDFYAQPFASQMMIWAVRRYLLFRSTGASGMVDVAHVFQMAGWEHLLESLLAVVDAMSAAEKLTLHQIHCPALVRHETMLINTLAALQENDLAAARTTLNQILPPRSTRDAIRHLSAFAALTQAQGLNFEFVKSMHEPVWMSPTQYREQRHVH